MITVNPSRNYPANGWDWYSDIGDAVALAMQTFHPVVSSKNLPTPATLYDYWDGAFMTLRWVSFVWVLTNFADTPQATLHSISSAFTNARSASFWAVGVGYKIRGNYLLNRNLFNAINLWRSLAFAFSINSNSPGTPTFANGTMQVIMKKVNAAGTITTLITYSLFTGMTNRWSWNFNDSYTAVLTGTPGSISEWDIVYLDTELTFDVQTNAWLSLSISQNPRNLSFLSII